MSLGLIGKKLGMTQIFDAEGNSLSVTIIQAGPCQVSQVKNVDSDGYNAVQIAFDPVREKRMTKPLLGHLSKAGIEARRVLREFRVDETQLSELSPGATLDVSLFNVGDHVDVIGTSKGRGFTGVMKRHNFHGAKATHGVHEYFRHGGSIGGTDAQHVSKGTKMPGRHGGSRVTVQNIQVADVRLQQHLLLLRGAVPGPNGGYVFIVPAKKMAAKVQAQSD